MQGLATGVGDVGRGLAVLRAHPALWKWIVAPAVIAAALVVGAVIGVIHLVDPMVGWMSAHLPSWLFGMASRLLTGMVVAVLIAAALFAFTSVVGLIAGPFLERLSEHVEAALTGEPPAGFSLAEFGHGVALSVIHSLRRLAASLIGLVLVFALGFVPVVGTAAALIAAVWFAATAAAYDCYDSIFSRHLMSYRAKLDYLARHRGRTLGLGLAVAGLLVVPGVNLIALGLGAAGATVANLAIQRSDAARSAVRDWR